MDRGSFFAVCAWASRYFPGDGSRPATRLCRIRARSRPERSTAFEDCRKMAALPLRRSGFVLAPIPLRDRMDRRSEEGLETSALKWKRPAGRAASHYTLLAVQA